MYLMCGITGYCSSPQNSVSDDNSILELMSECIKHRGPDDYATYVSDRCKLAIRRLAILDLTPGIYPFASPDGRFALVLNGEIYNFKEIRSELQSFGYVFKTNCDAEVILYGYIKWGNKVFEKLRGMFAIALWDSKEQKLTLVRDRLGIKPLYYFYSSDRSLYFSSEAKSLYNLPPEIYTPKLHYENTELLLGFMFLPKNDETIVDGINKLPPATILEFQNGDIVLKTYWQLEVDHKVNELTFTEAASQLEKLLIESVNIHLLSDAPLGVLLSGGVDSSLIAAIMSKTLKVENIHTFTAKFVHKFDESAFARTTANQLGTKHTEININTSDISKNIEAYAYSFDDLSTLDGGLITTQLLCESIEKTGIKVLLLGEGADELFGGYSWFGLSQYPYKMLPSYIRNAIYYYAISRNINVNFLYYSKYWNAHVANKDSIFRDISATELTLQLPNHLLMKVDKGSMASSIEARVPYLDHRLVEFGYSLNEHAKLAGEFYNSKRASEKFILREVAKKYLPSGIALRKKRGFMLPMKEVLDSNKDQVRDQLLATNSIGGKILGRKILEKLFEPAYGPFAMQHEYLKWRLFILENWSTAFAIK